MTWEGTKPIRELAGGVHRILGVDARWHWAPFKSYGVQRLWKLTLTRNRQVKEIYATDGHRWFVRAGKDQSSRREVVTTGLKAGDRLCYVFPGSRISQTVASPFGVAHGFTFGDGTRTRHRGSMALICPPKDEAILKYFPNSVTSASGPNLLVHHLPGFFKERPPLDESASYLLGWLAGYFAADGCVAKDGTVILNSASREDLEFVRLLCTRLGIATYGVTTQSRVGFEGREPSDLHRIHFVNDDLPPDFFLIPEHRERFVAAQKKFARRGWVVQSVEETEREEEVFCAEVEEGHAFVLEDNILTGNCFGCGEGGDVISFLMKHDGLAFAQAVEYLADRTGVQLRRTEEDDHTPRPKGPGRQRLVEAHKLAQEFYADQLGGPDAVAARQFLSERGFDQQAALTFGLGFAPRDGEALYKHLRQKRFSDAELVTAGLVAQGQRGHYDRFRGRLLWPIRETSGETIGFGARRIFDDDRIEAKYLNTPETPIYKKSQVLYGIDLARREIARSSQAVVVEGYTDVMACHLSGVGTAVATCGTAFGEDHGRVLRRLLHDHEEFRGEVIFTFDGDEAGQKAALRAFGGDQQFVGQTYVAVEPDGLDPCDLRLKSGDAAVRELVARRIPLYRFVLGNVVQRYDLDRADGRIDALREAAKLVSSIRDRSKVDAFARELAGMVGVDIEEARAEVRRASGRAPSGREPAAPAAAAPRRTDLPDLRDPRFALERETLKLVVQHPQLVAPISADLGGNDFTHPSYRAVWDAVAAHGGPAGAPEPEVWVGKLRDALSGAGQDPSAAQVLNALAVEPVLSARDPDPTYAAANVYRLLELTAMRRINDLKSKLQRTNPVDEATEYNRMFGELVALESHRRTLREKAIGAAG
ncbi:DNA primase [Nocardioides caldifontis]|uniref:DNA primase n=1 Tax=Nocardioides caldifontis TaxID=2588938 RepID=UPI003B84AEDD